MLYGFLGTIFAPQYQHENQESQNTASGSLKANLCFQISKARIQQGRAREHASLRVGTDPCPRKLVPMLTHPLTESRKFNYHVCVYLSSASPEVGYIFFYGMEDLFAFELLVYRRCEATESPGWAVLGKARLFQLSPSQPPPEELQAAITAPQQSCTLPLGPGQEDKGEGTLALSRAFSDLTGNRFL